MAPNSHRKLVVGWDVRGWMSNEQAVAALSIAGEKIKWLGFSERFRFPQSEPFTFSSLLKPIDGSDLWSSDFEESEIVIAIDAPLAFPVDYCSLVSGNPKPITPPASELSNTLAYRQCERWVKAQFGKKPLSAAFDKLGNNATLAITMCRSLQKEGFRVLPQVGSSVTRAIIEVYPGITKTGSKRIDPAILPLAQHIPSQCEAGTDIYDASICALLGAVYFGWGSEKGIPQLVQPVEEFGPAEGWIYCLPSDYVHSFQPGLSG